MCSEKETGIKKEINQNDNQINKKSNSTVIIILGCIIFAFIGTLFPFIFIMKNKNKKHYKLDSNHITETSNNNTNDGFNNKCNDNNSNNNNTQSNLNKNKNIMLNLNDMMKDVYKDESYSFSYSLSPSF